MNLTLSFMHAVVHIHVRLHGIESFSASLVLLASGGETDSKKSVLQCGILATWYSHTVSFANSASASLLLLKSK